MRDNLVPTFAQGLWVKLACFGSYSSPSSQDANVGKALPCPDPPQSQPAQQQPESAVGRLLYRLQPTRAPQRLAQPSPSRFATPASSAPRAADMPRAHGQPRPAHARRPLAPAPPRAVAAPVLLGCLLTLLPRVKGALAPPDPRGCAPGSTEALAPSSLCSFSCCTSSSTSTWSSATPGPLLFLDMDGPPCGTPTWQPARPIGPRSPGGGAPALGAPPGLPTSGTARAVCANPPGPAGPQCLRPPAQLATPHEATRPPPHATAPAHAAPRRHDTGGLVFPSTALSPAQSARVSLKTMRHLPPSHLPRDGAPSFAPHQGTSFSLLSPASTSHDYRHVTLPTGGPMCPAPHRAGARPAPPPPVHPAGTLPTRFRGQQAVASLQAYLRRMACWWNTRQQCVDATVRMLRDESFTCLFTGTSAVLNEKKRRDLA